MCVCVKENECECVCGSEWSMDDHFCRNQAAGLMVVSLWSGVPLLAPSCPDGPGQPLLPPGAPSRSPFGFPCIVHGLVPRGNGAAVWVRGRPPAAPPPSPHCHSWLWPLAPAADTKNSPAHKETATPLSGPPGLVEVRIASTELSQGSGSPQETQVRAHWGLPPLSKPQFPYL